MKKPSINFQYDRPAVFDWLVFILSFSLGFIFPNTGEFVLSKQFSGWMLVILVLYAAGSWLKHIPLSYRIIKTGRKRESPLMIFLLAGHWCIMLLLIIFAESAFFSLLGMPSMIDKNVKNDSFIFFTMIFSLYLTWLVYRSKKLPKSYKEHSAVWLARRELVADCLLIASVSVLTYVLWEKGIMTLLGMKAVESFLEVCFLFVMLSITYILLYLPLRYLYLIEDLSNRQTWKRMLLIFAFLLLRSFFEIMKR
jgi:hypothetical protein